MRNCLGLSIVTCLFALTISCARLPKGIVASNFSGHIYEQKFNNMPMMDKAKSKGRPIISTLYIYEPTRLNQIVDGLVPGPIVSKINSILIDSVSSDNTGAFSMYLKPGKYSVFVKYENGYYVPFYSGKDWASIIETKPNEKTELDIQVKVNSSYE
jgi:hypothetical protein